MTVELYNLRVDYPGCMCLGLENDTDRCGMMLAALLRPGPGVSFLLGPCGLPNDGRRYTLK